jgi:LysM repeat protein
MHWRQRSLTGPSRRARRTRIAIPLVALGVATSGCRHTQHPVAARTEHAPKSTVLYSVLRGDTIEQIAAWHGVSAAQIERLNELDVHAALDTGRTLVVPYRPLETVEVKPGDTLGALADSLGTDVTALAHLNAIADPRRVDAGVVLRIPANAQSRKAPAVTHATRPAAGPPAVAAPSPAKSEADDALAAARSAFDQAEFESAIAWADRAQRSVPASSQDPADRRRLANAQLVRGMAEVALGREPDARTSFARALELDDTIDLDPGQTSPKVLSVFREVRGR